MNNLDCSSFKPSSLQATIFTPDQDHSASQIMKKIFPKWSDIFDGDPEVVPSLPAFPAEVPRVIFKNIAGTIRFEAAAARINFFKRIKAEDEFIDSVEFYKDSIRLFTDFLSNTESRIGRLAAIRTMFAKHEHPGLYLSRHFCKEIWDNAPLNRPENFEIHAHKVYPMGKNLRVNSWARSKTGTLIKKVEQKEKPEQTQAILFEQDLNTLEEEAKEKSFNQEEIENFFNLAPPEFDKILGLYFPKSDGEKNA